MSEELTLLKEIGADTEKASPEIEERAHAALVAAIAREHSKIADRLRRWPFAFGCAAAVAACAAVAIVLVARSGTAPGIADKAYGAISPRSGIMHFVAQYDLPKRHYAEHWIDLRRPVRQRIVYSAGGRVSAHRGQIVYTGRPEPRLTAKDTNRQTIVTAAPSAAPSGVLTAGSDPTLVYRKLLHAGTVRSESKTVYRGRPAYRLVIDWRPPYKLVGNVWTGERLVYVVDRRTYFPLESTWRSDPSMGGGTSTIRYPVFEILPDTAQTRALLEPAKNPQPYHP